MATSSTSFKKGKSGNPGGQSKRVGPNGETLAELARAQTALAVSVLVEVCKDKGAEPRDRIHAANGILDRGWGKPRESVDLDANITGAGIPIIQIVRYEESPEGA